jgi:hypothetical protein
MCGAGSRQALQTDIDAGRVHQVEHELHALQLLAEEEALATVVLTEDEGAGGRAVDAHLLFDVVCEHVVGLAKRTVGVDPDLRNDEEREPLGAGRGVRCACQHQVDDVVDQVVITAGDEDLFAGDGVGAVILLDCLGGGCTDIRSGLRLGQAHGAGPLPGEELLDEEGLLLVGAETLDHGARTASQHEGQ